MENEIHGQVASLLIGRALTVALAESATGGSISALLTEMAGSSRYFLGAVVAYDNAAKTRLLGVQQDTLASHGAVSREVALEMAEGARRAFGADVGLADTGIAGPGGGTPGKPVGLYFVALAAAGHAEWRLQHFTGDRAANRRQAAHAVLSMLRDFLCRLDGEA